MRAIWVNGAFGAGKTTLAQQLIADDPQLLLFDAELPGFMLREVAPLPPSGDFQDLRVWRRSVVDTAVALAQEYQRTLVVPMTVVVWFYLDGILIGLRACGMDVAHYFITVPTGSSGDGSGAVVVATGPSPGRAGPGMAAGAGESVRPSGSVPAGRHHHPRRNAARGATKRRR
ncbi:MULTISPECIES: hypothetical protein [unclassified Micromonospora]|uniref:hypothetical protein n=1 Tax=unclassified Micromonospora TaxID=2617518 RepID=UPI0036438B1B